MRPLPVVNFGPGSWHRGPTKWGRRLSSGAVGGVLWVHHSTRILSRPESEACLDKIRSGGACPPDEMAPTQVRQGLLRRGWLSRWRPGLPLGQLRHGLIDVDLALGELLEQFDLA